MTVYEAVKNFTIGELANLFAEITISSAKGALGNSPSYLMDKIDETREGLREGYIRLLNDEMP